MNGPDIIGIQLLQMDIYPPGRQCLDVYRSGDMVQDLSGNDEEKCSITISSDNVYTI